MPNSRPKRALPLTPGKFVAAGTGPNPNHPPLSLCETSAGEGCARPAPRPKPREGKSRKPVVKCEMTEKQD